MKSNILAGAFFLFSILLISSFFLINISMESENKGTPQLKTQNVLTFEDKKSIVESFGRIPLHFEENQAKTGDVHFLSRNGNHTLLLKKTEAELVLMNRENKKADVLKMKLAGEINKNPEIEGIDKLGENINYFVGNDPDNWKENVSTYGKVKYKDVYEGIDLVYYGNQSHIEYDFVVAPNIDPNTIKLNFENAKNIELDENGDLLLTVGDQIVRQKAPITYQETDGIRKEIHSKYVVKESDLEKVFEIGFEIGEYDQNKSLIIDPVIVFSTLLGGSAGDLFNVEAGFSIKVDADGNVYVAGTTPSGDFPVEDPHQPSSGGNFDSFITKFDPTGSTLIFSTYFGGSNADRIYSLSLGPANQIFVSGFTASTDFPTVDAFQATNNGAEDGFISKFKNSGSLEYSTYIGGSGGENCAFSQSVSENIVAFAGSTGSVNFPTANALQASNAGQTDFFAGKLDISTNTLIFSTYLGGSFNDSMIFSSGGLDSSGNIYVAGVSNSIDFPTTQNAFQPENNGSDDAIVLKISSTGNSLLYATFVGGNLVDSADALAVDGSGNAYITGFTRSANFPSKNAIQTQLRDVDSFVTKLNPTGTELVFSTLLGGNNLERGSGIATDVTGNCYVTGRSNSGDFPVKRALRPPRGLDDVFISKFNRDGALLFSTLIGGRDNDNAFGITADASNNVYVTGTATRNFFTTPGAFQTTTGGSSDAFVAKINTSIRTVKSDFDGDGKSDLAVFRPSTGVWYVLKSSGDSVITQPFGLNGDIPVPGDYDGDQKTDLAVYRPSQGSWFILNSKTGSVKSVFWGIETDVPVQGDYDGDGNTDIAVYRPSSGVWYIIRSSNNGLRTVTLGTSSDKPVQADYDGDGVTDVAVYRPNSGVWFYVGSTLGVISQQFGVSTDKPVPADYDGDGYDDISVFRPNGGIWFRLQSGSSNSLFIYQWGNSQDIPTAGDYDGDGKEDIAVFRPSNGTWFVTRDSGNSFFSAPFGLNGDIPIPSAYVP